MAAVDILYIDITRRWNSMTMDQRDSGTSSPASLMSCGRTDRDGQYLFSSFFLRVRLGEEDDHIIATKPDLGVFGHAQSSQIY